MAVRSVIGRWREEKKLRDAETAEREFLEGMPPEDRWKYQMRAGIELVKSMEAVMAGPSRRQRNKARRRVNRAVGAAEEYIPLIGYARQVLFGDANQGPIRPFDFKNQSSVVGECGRLHCFAVVAIEIRARRKFAISASADGMSRRLKYLIKLRY